MKIRPLHDRVVVRRTEKEETTAGGPGKVLDNGDVRPVDLKVGDKVIFGQYAGSTVKVEGEELLILGENEIFGVLTG